MKVIATEFWTKVFQKNISNLQTNNKGKFKLQDDGCRLLGKLVDIEEDEEDSKANQELDQVPSNLDENTASSAAESTAQTDKPLTLGRKQRMMRKLVVEFITGMVKGALDTLNLNAH